MTAPFHRCFWSSKFLPKTSTFSNCLVYFPQFFRCFPNNLPSSLCSRRQLDYNQNNIRFIIPCGFPCVLFDSVEESFLGSFAKTTWISIENLITLQLCYYWAEPDSRLNAPLSCEELKLLAFHCGNLQSLFRQPNFCTQLDFLVQKSVFHIVLFLVALILPTIGWFVFYAWPIFSRVFQKSISFVFFNISIFVISARFCQKLSRIQKMFWNASFVGLNHLYDYGFAESVRKHVEKEAASFRTTRSYAKLFQTAKNSVVKSCF